MARYKVKDGTHTEGGVRFTRGEVVETRVRLDRLFPASGKFEKTDEPATEKGPGGTASMLEDEGDEGAATDLGEDVTEKFADAGDLDLTVYKQGRKYNVTEKGETAVLNEEPLTNMDEVNDFVAKYKR